MAMNLTSVNAQLDGDATRDSEKAKATSYLIGDVATMEEEAHFVTGSSYKGSWDALGMSGVGRYTMPNGTVYEGEIRDGMFHGHGSIYLHGNRRLDVVHHRGELRDHRYTFADGLPYRDNDWSYCKFPDRRFYECTKKGLRPGGRCLKTAKQPTKVLPPGCYDTGDGVYDPKTLRITSYDDSTQVLRTPGKEERDWIVNNCRKSWTEPTGYRDSLIENWSDEPPELPYHLAFSKDSPDGWWKRLTTFATDVVDDGKDKVLSDSHVPELCMCGQYVMLGEPCRCTSASIISELESHDNSIGKNCHTKEWSDSHDDDGIEHTDIDSKFDSISSTDGTSESTIGKKNNSSDVETRSNYVLEVDGSTTFLHRIPGEYSADENIVDEMAKAKIKCGNIQPLKNDHNRLTDATSPRVKIPKAGDPETKNYCVTETKVFPKPKANNDEHCCDNVNAEIESTKEHPKRDLSFYPENKKAITCYDKIIQGKNIPLETTSNGSKLSITEEPHSSLASRSPTFFACVPSNEKCIVEIYNKSAKTQNPKNECQNTTVWRLSSGTNDCGTRPKIPCYSCGYERKANVITSA